MVVEELLRKSQMLFVSCSFFVVVGVLSTNNFPINCLVSENNLKKNAHPRYDMKLGSELLAFLYEKIFKQLIITKMFADKFSIKTINQKHFK